MVALAIAVMIGDGCCAFVSISLGQGDQAAAKRSVGNAVVMSVAGSLVLTAVYLLLPVFFGLDGVLLSMPVSDLLTFLVALVLIRRTYRELNEKGRLQA